jgi:chemosensory pili system protein ChpA (sensor histidine kinase/response regulator)
VHTAKNGLDALEQLSKVKPDVMLVDIEMPQMDGFEFTRAVRGAVQHKDIPIIMITSRTAEKHRQHALDLGVNVFLGKPYTEKDLLSHIAEQGKDAA